MQEDDVLNADEDAVDRLTLDVTVTNVADLRDFGFELNYPAPQVSVILFDPKYFLDTGNTLDISESTPDTDGSFLAQFVNLAEPITGSGILGRVTLETTPTASPGQFPMSLTNPVHESSGAFVGPPERVDDAILVVGSGPFPDTCNPDADGDGVCTPGYSGPNCTGEDLCPGTPPGSEADANGCAIIEPPAVGGIVGLIDNRPQRHAQGAGSGMGRTSTAAAALTVAAVASVAFILWRRLRHAPS
jgi:hypothetical protein